MKAVPSHELDCESARELASARCDGERVDAALLERHLYVCADCRDFADAIARAGVELRGLLAPAARDPWLAIQTRARRRRAREWTLRAGAALVGCAATLALLELAGRAPTPIAQGGALAQLAELETPSTEQQRLSQSPELQLLVAVAAAREHR